MKTARIFLTRSLASAALCLGFLNLARAHELLFQCEGTQKKTSLDAAPHTSSVTFDLYSQEAKYDSTVYYVSGPDVFEQISTTSHHTPMYWIDKVVNKTDSKHWDVYVFWTLKVGDHSSIEQHMQADKESGLLDFSKVFKYGDNVLTTTITAHCRSPSDEAAKK